ncbi:MAG: hypothetical protein HY282_02595 [Nitrospirae bacterium]|nr:hypothetical protein [Candidatus Manganitrophaceae bacterium]
MLIGEQRPFSKIFQDHLGAPAVFCHEAYLSLGTCQTAPAPADAPSLFIGGQAASLHALHFSRTDLAAIPVETRQQRSIAREFGIEPFSTGYGIEQSGTGIGMGNVLRYDAYLFFYERTSLEWLALTEQATSDPASAAPFEWEKLTWADRRRAALLMPYGYILGTLQIDAARGRLLLTDGSLPSPSFTVFRSGISFKSASFKTLPKIILDQMGAAPMSAYELNRFSEWKEHTEAIGRLLIF